MREISRRSPARKNRWLSSSANSISAVFAGLAREALHFGQRFFRNQRAHFARQALEFVIDLRHGQAVAVGGHHGDRVRLQQQQRAIQRVA